MTLRRKPTTTIWPVNRSRHAICIDGVIDTIASTPQTSETKTAVRIAFERRTLFLYWLAERSSGRKLVDTAGSGPVGSAVNLAILELQMLDRFEESVIHVLMN